MPRARVVIAWRAVMIGACLLSAADIWAGYAHPPGDHSRGIVSLGRIGLSVALALTLLLGPGIALASLRHRITSLTFLCVPGFAVCVGLGVAAWIGHPIGGHRVVAVCTALVLGLVAVVAVIRPVGIELDRADTRALVIVFLVFLVALGKTFYSIGTEGELYQPLISRTLEVGDRGDARISYHVVQLIANGISPFTDEGQANFLPFTFSDRGPLPGTASAALVLLAGGQPPVVPPDQPWHPFDPQGFEAYRIMMVTLAATALLAVYGLVRELRGVRTARFALAIAATTPFLIHETYFTWPKLMAAGFVVMAGQLILRRQPVLAGWALGMGYLCHPVALTSIPVLVLLMAWIAWRTAGVRLAGEARSMAMLAVGPLATLAFWRVINGSRFTQTGFLQYLKSVSIYHVVPLTLGSWFAERVASTLNTLVPLHLFIAYSDSRGINSFYAPSPPIVHFFFQYWNTVPFGFGIVFTPVLVVGLVRGFRRHAWAVAGLVVIPLVSFIVYYGVAETGLMREGLHAWVLTVVIVYAWVRASLPSQRWERSWLMSIVLAGRSLEILLMLLLPAWVTMRQVTTTGLHTTDAAALVLMIGGVALLGRESLLANRELAGIIPRDARRVPNSTLPRGPANST